MINFKTKIEYTNSNFETLAEAGYASPFWMTFNQAKELGYQVNKGEKGTQIIRVVEKKVYNETLKKEEKKKVVKKYYVFNLEQVTKTTEEKVA